MVVWIIDFEATIRPIIPEGDYSSCCQAENVNTIPSSRFWFFQPPSPSPHTLVGTAVHFHFSFLFWLLLLVFLFLLLAHFIFICRLVRGSSVRLFWLPRLLEKMLKGWHLFFAQTCPWVPRLMLGRWVDWYPRLMLELGDRFLPSDARTRWHYSSWKWLNARVLMFLLSPLVAHTFLLLLSTLTLVGLKSISIPGSSQ